MYRERDDMSIEQEFFKYPNALKVLETGLLALMVDQTATMVHEVFPENFQIAESELNAGNYSVAREHFKLLANDFRGVADRIDQLDGALQAAQDLELSRMQPPLVSPISAGNLSSPISADSLPSPTPSTDSHTE